MLGEAQNPSVEIDHGVLFRNLTTATEKRSENCHCTGVSLQPVELLLFYFA